MDLLTAKDIQKVSSSKSPRLRPDWLYLRRALTVLWRPGSNGQANMTGQLSWTNKEDEWKREIIDNPW
jgi:hypothetical protein